MFKIRTGYTLFWLKKKSGVMYKLEKLGVFLCHSQFETIKSRAIGTLFKSHSFFTCCEDVLQELNQKIKEAMLEEGPPFLLTLGFQSHLPPLSYIGESPIIKQDMILIEAEMKHTDKVFGKSIHSDDTHRSRTMAYNRLTTNHSHLAFCPNRWESYKYICYEVK